MGPNPGPVISSWHTVIPPYLLCFCRAVHHGRHAVAARCCVRCAEQLGASRATVRTARCVIGALLAGGWCQMRRVLTTAARHKYRLRTRRLCGRARPMRRRTYRRGGRVDEHGEGRPARRGCRRRSSTAAVATAVGGGLKDKSPLSKVFQNFQNIIAK